MQVSFVSNQPADNGVFQVVPVNSLSNDPLAMSIPLLAKINFSIISNDEILNELIPHGPSKRLGVLVEFPADIDPNLVAMKLRMGISLLEPPFTASGLSDSYMHPSQLETDDDMPERKRKRQEDDAAVSNYLHSFKNHSNLISSPLLQDNEMTVVDLRKKTLEKTSNPYRSSFTRKMTAYCRSYFSESNYIKNSVSDDIRTRIYHSLQAEFPYLSMDEIRREFVVNLSYCRKNHRAEFRRSSGVDREYDNMPFNFRNARANMLPAEITVEPPTTSSIADIE